MRGYRDRSEEVLRRKRLRGIALIAGGEPVTARKWSALVDETPRIFIENLWTLVYCGMGSGLAGEIARSVLAAQGRVKAIVVQGCEPPDIPTGVEAVVVKNFHQRRSKLLRAPLGFLVLPGGPGTLAEFTELAAWHAAGLLGERPVVLLDPENWFEPVVYFYEKAKRAKVSRWPPRRMFHRVPDVKTAKRILADAIESID
jgi:predicted Rossmann-fold nucleotide-binding protein